MAPTGAPLNRVLTATVAMPRAGASFAKAHFATFLAPRKTCPWADVNAVFTSASGVTSTLAERLLTMAEHGLGAPLVALVARADLRVGGLLQLVVDAFAAHEGLVADGHFGIVIVRWTDVGTISAAHRTYFRTFYKKGAAPLLAGFMVLLARDDSGVEELRVPAASGLECVHDEVMRALLGHHAFDVHNLRV